MLQSSSNVSWEGMIDDGRAQHSPRQPIGGAPRGTCAGHEADRDILFTYEIVNEMGAYAAV